MDPRIAGLHEHFTEMGYRQHHPNGDPNPGMPPLCPAGSAARFDLTWHEDQRGAFMELFRQSWVTPRGRGFDGPDDGFARQVYISSTLPGVVKAWHVHAIQTDRFAVVRGAVVLGLYDLPSSPEKVTTIILNASRQPKTVMIPPGVAHGWMALPHPDGEAWIVNMCSHEYDGTDEWRRDARTGPSGSMAYDWRSSVDG